MNPMIVQGPQSYSPLHHDLLEALVSVHYERAYAIFNAFEEDPEVCLRRTDALFRAVADEGRLSPIAIYGMLVERIENLSEPEAFPPGISRADLLCWLIKETAQLSYGELGMVMCMDADAVKYAIANVRMALLECM